MDYFNTTHVESTRCCYFFHIFAMACTFKYTSLYNKDTTIQIYKLKLIKLEIKLIQFYTCYFWDKMTHFYMCTMLFQYDNSNLHQWPPQSSHRTSRSLWQTHAQLHLDPRRWKGRCRSSFLETLGKQSIRCNLCQVHSEQSVCNSLAWLLSYAFWHLILCCISLYCVTFYHVILSCYITKAHYHYHVT